MEIKYKSLSIGHLATPGNRNAPDDLSDGEFIGYASTFDRTPDAQGDVVAPTAFTRTIAEHQADDLPIAVVYGHDMDDPYANVGTVTATAIDSKGLRIRGHLDVADNPKARQVYNLLKSRRLRELSIGYTVRDQGIVTLPDGRKANELRDIDLKEISVVPLAANPHATISGVKAQHIISMNISNQGAALTTTEQLDKTVEEMKSINDAAAAEKRDLTGEENKRIVELGAKADRLRGDIDVAGKAADTLRKQFPSTNSHSYDWEDNKASSTPTQLAKGFINFGEYGKSIPKSLREYASTYHSKALLPAGQTIVQVPIVNSMPIAGDQGAEIPPRLVNHLITVTRPASVYDVLTETTPATPGAASVVADGDEKPIRKLGLSRVEQRLKVVAVLTEPLNRYILEDWPNLDAWLGQRLPQFIMDALESEILTGDGTGEHFTGLAHVTGVKTQAYTTSAFNTVAAGLNQLESIGVAPSMIVLSASDWLAIETATNSQNVAYMTNYINPASRTLFGVQIVVAPSLSAGNGWIIGQNALELSTDGQQRIEWDNTSGFTRNEIQARAEGRYNLDVLKPHALVNLTLTGK
jgi:HK97 family phage prohead protease/HK97 family phage major capsid protein